MGFIAGLLFLYVLAVIDPGPVTWTLFFIIIGISFAYEKIQGAIGKRQYERQLEREKRARQRLEA